MRISDWSSDVCSSDLPSPSPSKYSTCSTHGASIEASIERARSGEALTIGNPRSDPRESWRTRRGWPALGGTRSTVGRLVSATARSEEHTSELQSLMLISYAVFCLKQKTNNLYY